MPIVGCTGSNPSQRLGGHASVVVVSCRTTTHLVQAIHAPKHAIIRVLNIFIAM